MHTKTNQVKVDRGIALKYLNDIDNDETITDDMVDKEASKVA